MSDHSYYFFFRSVSRTVVFGWRLAYSGVTYSPEPASRNFGLGCEPFLFCPMPKSYREMVTVKHVFVQSNRRGTTSASSAQPSDNAPEHPDRHAPLLKLIGLEVKP